MADNNIRELIEAARNLLEWVPVCSPGSSGYIRTERLRAAVDRCTVLDKVCPKPEGFNPRMPTKF